MYIGENLAFFQYVGTVEVVSERFIMCAYTNLEAKFSAVNLLNSGVMTYLLWSGISFSAAVRAIVVAQLLILGVLFLT